MSLLIRINRCLLEGNITPTRFGRLAVNDPRLVGDLRRGRELRAATRRRVEALLTELHA